MLQTVIADKNELRSSHLPLMSKTTSCFAATVSFSWLVLRMRVEVAVNSNLAVKNPLLYRGKIVYNRKEEKLGKQSVCHKRKTENG